MLIGNAVGIPILPEGQAYPGQEYGLLSAFMGLVGRLEGGRKNLIAPTRPPVMKNSLQKRF